MISSSVSLTRKIFSRLVLFLLCALVTLTPPPTAANAEGIAIPTEKPPAVSIGEDDPRFAGIEAAVRQEIDAGHIPGAVVLIGHQGQVVYQRAFGHRWLGDNPLPMTIDTIFDIASLTKVVATTTAIMQLWDRRLLKIDDPVIRHWREFSPYGKKSTTLRQLLIHTSGLREGIKHPDPDWSNYPEAMQVIVQDKLFPERVGRFKYSDVDFIVLGEIVQRLTGQRLDCYCAEKIFQPLKMATTAFNPPESWLGSIAPCDKKECDWYWGKVRDPDASQLGGVAGNAGVFSTASDLSLFIQMLLNRGEGQGKRLLSRKAVVAMTRPQSISASCRRGLGWDMQSPWSKRFNKSFPAGSFGHTGHTGTSIWIDRPSKTYLIILTNRLHPNGTGNAQDLREKIAAAVALALPMGPPALPEKKTTSELNH
jgi:serine-type D-Ala-D-Ala carboxypeptidase